MAQKILPSLRAMIAIKLQEDYGMNQSEVAKKLGLSQPAVLEWLKRR